MISHPIGTKYKTTAGVYVFARDEGKTWSIIYAGQAQDLNARVGGGAKNHHRIDCIKRNKATHILTRVVAEKSKRDALEQALIEKYDPPCNRE